MEVRIYYEDTDCGGVVYYANYLKYFERARTDYLERHGFSIAQLMKEGTIFMVVRAELEYKSPARLGDKLVIETVLSEQGKASFRFSHVIREKTSGRVVVEGSATIIATTPEGKVRRIEPELMKRLDVRTKGAV
jgi:acyl-CoA thioester hydrolase